MTYERPDVAQAKGRKFLVLTNRKETSALQISPELLLKVLGAIAK